MNSARPRIEWQHLKRLRRFLIAIGVLGVPPHVSGADTSATPTPARAPLTVEAKIPLGDIRGRIDHLAFDPRRQRLYVAELGSNSVGIVDLAERRLIRTVGGFDEPQGIGYEPKSDAIYVANGGDGSVRVFRGDDFSALGQIQLADDADNVRIDQEAHRIYVGYGAGALAVIDPATRKQLAGISLKGHPESFQLDPAGDLIFVNVPDAGEIAVVSRNSQRQVSSWPTGKLHANYPLALDPVKGRVIAIFRQPARLESFELRTGQKLHGSDVCGDSDDVFVDPKRQHVYVVCGEGFIDVLDSSGEDYAAVGRIRSSEGSRTGLFVSELDRLLVAIRASGKESAAIWVLRPAP